MRPQKILLLATLLLVSLVGLSQSRSKVLSVKVAFLPHFVENVTWTNERNFKTFTLGYLGSDPLIEKNIKGLLEQRPNMKGIPVIFKKYSSIEELDDKVQCLFIDEKFNKDVFEVYKKIGGAQTLLITSECKSNKDVMINLLEVDKGHKEVGVAFKVNRANILAQGLFALPTILQHGGREIDVAKMYRKAKDEMHIAMESLEKERNKGQAYEQEIFTLLSDIQGNKSQLLEQEEQIKTQLKDIERRKKELQRTRAEYYQTQQILAAQNTEVTKRQKLLEKQEQELFDKKKLLARYNKKLNVHSEKIDSQQREIVQQRHDIDTKNIVIEQQQLVLIITITGVCIVILLFFLLYRGYKQKQKSNRKLEEQATLIEQKNVILGEQAEKLQVMNGNLNSQNEQLVQAHDSIQDSISYASRLQHSILPVMTTIQETFPDLFVIYNPMKQLSGDFYFYRQVRDQHFFAVVDCTGHSVPGALISMLGYNALTEIITQGTHNTGEILNQLHEQVISALIDVEDGMDMAMCKIDTQEKKLYFSGAKNPFVFFDQNDEFNIIKSRSHSIGGMLDIERDYETYEFSLENIKKFYLFSDGYQDQFGGEKDKKLGVKRFHKLIQKYYTDSMDDQKEQLEDFFAEWKGGVEQIDDVTILGVDINHLS